MGRRWFRSSQSMMTSDRPNTAIRARGHADGDVLAAREKKSCSLTDRFRAALSFFRFSLPRLSRPRSINPQLTCRMSRRHARHRRRHPRLPSGCITGTIYGYRGGSVSLALHASPKRPPTLVINLATPTNALFEELHSGPVCLALECRDKRPNANRKKEKRKKKKKNKKENEVSSSAPDAGTTRTWKMRRACFLKTKYNKRKTWFLKEAEWEVTCNGKREGIGERRRPTEDDIEVTELLRPVSTGAGVLPGRSNSNGPDWEIAYIRAPFERSVGPDGDSQTLRMVNPGGGKTGGHFGPDLTVCFARV